MKAIRSLTALMIPALICLTSGCGGDNSDDTANAWPPKGAQKAGDSANEAAAEPQPFDGGTYTWKSGIRMDTKVEKVEPWGDLDDFCGDGSCGVANPDDIRFVLRYSITVPEDFDGNFEPYSCPGDLEPMNGNADEALSGVAGDYDRSIDDVVMPGSTKFGVDEYYIEKDYADESFYLLTTCGDPNGEESAQFTGKIEQP